MTGETRNGRQAVDWWQVKTSMNTIVIPGEMNGGEISVSKFKRSRAEATKRKRIIVIPQKYHIDQTLSVPSLVAILDLDLCSSQYS